MSFMMTRYGWGHVPEPVVDDEEPKADPADPLVGVCRTLLAQIGEDPDREGLRDTPRRWAAWWREFTEYEAGTLTTTFASAADDQLVAVSGMRIWSLCEHHLLPFHADIAVGYIPGERVLGLSKFGRIAQMHAHRLQVQERLVAGIADDVSTLTGSDDVAVVAAGEHLCMVMRGVRTPARMETSVMRGAFRDKPEARNEFLALVKHG